jgi:uncharacterized protein with HEPN domain
MKSHDLVRVKHMIEAVDEAIGFAQSKKRGDLNKDRMLTVALMREIEVVGEAALGYRKILSASILISTGRS